MSKMGCGHVDVREGQVADMMDTQNKEIDQFIIEDAVDLTGPCADQADQDRSESQSDNDTCHRHRKKIYQHRKEGKSVKIED